MSKEKRIYAYPIEMMDADKETLIEQAELSLGMVWTIENFIIALNNDEINDQDYYYGTYEAEVFDSNVVVNKLELASELAHDSAKDELIVNMLIDNEDDMWVEDEDAMIYTELAQGVFNRWYDYYLTKIEEIAR